MLLNKEEGGLFYIFETAVEEGALDALDGDHRHALQNGGIAVIIRTPPLSLYNSHAYTHVSKKALCVSQKQRN